MAKRVADLRGADLDRWVALAHGMMLYHEDWQPSRNWNQAGSLIKDNHISICWCYASRTWMADCPRFEDGKFVGRTQQWSNHNDPLVAAMRCFVASRLGPEVEDESC